MPEDADKSKTMWPGPSSQGSHEGMGPERRIAKRYPFTAAAEVVDLRSKARVTGRSSDLGSGGCYIDTLAPFAVGATVQIRLERDQHKFEAIGVVTYALVSMGMGLAFTDIKPEQQATLKEWVAELSGEKEGGPGTPVAPSEKSLLEAVSNNCEVLKELIKVMVRRKVINESEAAALLRQMYR
jgi:hypothetical protein